ncbi:DUF5522 domain-containing protein [Telluribacter sp.]|jgi:hypothetical protein|uniref:DUF5522 domain-containing protein n=1 Tax=Telluribacter sp. TaxID=1978767 RepID=UPI002E13CFB0|nr:DUF5522 domain-containing protein [Telluribacter sp.]
MSKNQTRLRKALKPKLTGLTEDDYYLNDKGFVVFTEKYHLRRGYCCKSGCLHCPYGFNPKQTREVPKPESK